MQDKKTIKKTYAPRERDRVGRDGLGRDGVGRNGGGAKRGWGETGVGRVPVSNARAKSEKGSANTVSCITVFQLQSGRYRHYVLTVLPKHGGSRGRRAGEDDGGIFCLQSRARRPSDN